jgi:hypothetical protein
MQTEAGELGQIWRNIGRLEATVTAIRRELNQMRRDMREKKVRAGIPLWVHLIGMGVISAMSALGLVRPEMAISFMRLLSKGLAG